MNASTSQLGRGRAAGLVLIALVALGLGYARFAGGSDRVSVPSGAPAGQLTLGPCTYRGEPADCGTLVVRENRHDAHSRLIALPVTRIRAKAADPGAPIFRLQGGPGITNMDFPEASRFSDRHDVVLVGYRGVDGSSRLDCPEVASSRERSRDWLSAASLEADANALRDCATRLRGDGVDLGGYSLPERVDDLELVRHKLGYGPIDLVSESAGTRTALIYAWRYPQSIHRSVMIGVNPPGHFLWNAQTTREQLRKYAALCARASDCSKRTDDLAASVDSAFERIPSHWWFLPVKQGNIRAGAFFGLFNATSDGGGPLAAPLTLDTLLSIDRGDAGGAWFLSVAAQLMFPRAQVVGEAASFARIDAAYAKQFFAGRADRGSAIGSASSDFVWMGGRLLDAWPAGPDDALYNRVRDSRVETLLVGGELDFTTPPQVATRELLPHLPNGRQVVLPTIGHSEDFWAYEPAASTRLIDTYLDKGRVDTSLYTENRIDFSPSVTHGTIAEIVLGVLLGLAGVTALSLLWIAGRLHRGASFGRKGSVAARALLPLVLGLGGWCLGALVVLTALPTVPLTDQVLAVLSIAPPVAAAVYAGWFRRAASGMPASVGAFAALSTAALGAWLGFHVPGTPLLGALTAIVGASAAANLALIALDVAAPAPAGADEPGPQDAETIPGPA
ncbi:MAG TPA: alpha/beta fold hydrolase [Gaiellaceae bacterium]